VSTKSRREEKDDTEVGGRGLGHTPGEGEEREEGMTMAVNKERG